MKTEHIVIDLNGISTRDEFAAEMARHVAMEKDHSRLWLSIYRGLIWRSHPYTVRVCGWSEFKTRMPRYARRLRLLLLSYTNMWEKGVILSSLNEPNLEFVD